MTNKKGILQVGLAIGIASFVLGYLLVKNFDFSSVLAGKKNPWDQKKDGSCAIGRLCRAPDDIKNKEKDGATSCVTVQEGCVIEEKCTLSNGQTKWYNKGRNPNCGHKETTNQVTSTHTPLPTHTPTPTPTSTPIVTSTPTVTPTETPVPSGTPNFCGGTCGSNSNCQSGLFCFNGFCRNPNNPNDVNCSGPTPTPTVPPVLGATAPPSLPQTGSNDWLTFLGLLGIMGGGVLIFRKFRLL